MKMNRSPLRGLHPRRWLTNPLKPSNPILISVGSRYKKYLGAVIENISYRFISDLMTGNDVFEEILSSTAFGYRIINSCPMENSLIWINPPDVLSDLLALYSQYLKVWIGKLFASAYLTCVIPDSCQRLAKLSIMELLSSGLIFFGRNLTRFF